MVRWLSVFVLGVGCATGGEDSELPRPDGGVDTLTATDTSEPSADSGPPMETSVDTGPIFETEPPDADPMTTTLAIDTTECKLIACPASHPYVVGCSVVVGGSSSQLCVVHTAGSTTVNFKEGQSCGGEAVKGTIVCSTAMGTGLDATNCTSNKSKPLYITAIGACPT